jgi:hypothetical protein
LGNFAEQFRSSESSAPSVAGYTSMMLQLYTETLLDENEELQILDLGPVCGENVMFFAQQVKRLCVCDLFIRMDRNLKKGKSLRDLFEYLDYPDGSFYGIHLWDIIDHLQDRDANRLVHLCHRMLRPGGLMTAVAFEESIHRSPLIASFVVRDKYQVSLRPQTHLDLPWYFRSNRQLASLLSKFSRVSSFLSRSGIREFLLERD